MLEYKKLSDDELQTHIDAYAKLVAGGIRKEENEEKLVGFVMRGDLVPEDGQPIIENGSPIGRVTISRLSPTLKKGFGLGWVPEKLAEEGVEILIRIGDIDWPAVVATEPIYDPEGERLRS